MDDPRVAAVPVRECGEPLVDIGDGLRTADRRQLGDGRSGRVRRGVYERLVRAEDVLPDGVHLLVIEGHRSVHEQQRLIDSTRLQIERARPELSSAELATALARFVAPIDVAGHLAGAAVDLTLCDEAGQELDMGSAEAQGEIESDGLCWFDADVPEQARDHRNLLAQVLTDQGFVNYPSEWWHWSWGDRYWAATIGAAEARYGPAGVEFDDAHDAATAAVAAHCDNIGRWGEHDELGTLNLITPQARVRSAALVRSGRVVSLASPVSTVASAVNVRPAWHVMHLETERPYATADSVHLQIHGLGITHIDALGHMFLDGVGYNGMRQRDIVDMSGLQALDVQVMSGGIVTRGVLLDVAATTGRSWLDAGDYVTADLLEQAERRAGLQVGAGDALVVHVGLERRESQLGAEDPAVRAGLSLDALQWLFDRGVALYTGDCIERFPERGTLAPMPLHQIGIARMGLALLDAPSLSPLLAAVDLEQRAEFMFMVAPLSIPGGTGSPVNPLAIF